MATPKLTLDEQNTRLVLRFTCAVATLSQYLEKDPENWHDLLHPLLTTFLRGESPGFDNGKLEELESRLLKLWAKYGGSGEAPRARCDELLMCLELTLAQYHTANISYFSAVCEWLSDVERIELLHLATTRSPGPVRRRNFLHALYPNGVLPSPAKSDPPSKGEPTPISPPPPMGLAAKLTRTQQLVADQLLRLGRLYFDEDRPRMAIEPRLNPLIVGRTGAGKGHVVAHVARQLNCPVLHITFGDWTVNGASSQYTPTLWAIIERYLTTDKLIVVLDELDKFDANVADSNLSGWSRSACAELWALLDRRLPVDEFLRAGKAAIDPSALRETLIEQTTKRLWIIGIGTWEHLHKLPARRLGFTRDIPEARQAIAQRLAISSGISTELLYRFNPTPIELSYPPKDEIAQLLDETGIAAEARRRGVEVDVDALDLNRGGMRVLEDLVTQILLATPASNTDLKRAEQPPAIGLLQATVYGNGT